MKRKLTYIVVLATTLLFGPFLLSVNHYVYASDVPCIAFSSKRNGNYDIYMMDINGKNLQQLTDRLANETWPTFSPDGQRMAYVSSRDGNEDIYVMNLTTKVSDRLTNHPARDFNPAWSPDGRWIAFVSERAGTLDIYKIEPGGANLQQLTHADEKNNTPAWSPDSQFYRFSCFQGPSGYLYNGCGWRKSDQAQKPTRTGMDTRVVSRWETDCLYCSFRRKIMTSTP